MLDEAGQPDIVTDRAAVLWLCPEAYCVHIPVTVYEPGYNYFVLKPLGERRSNPLGSGRDEAEAWATAKKALASHMATATAEAGPKQ